MAYSKPADLHQKLVKRKPLAESYNMPMKKQSREPVGRKIQPPLNLCSRNMPRAMYPITVQLCWYCSQNVATKECFQFNSGRINFNLAMCPRCVEYNMAVQSVGLQVLQRQKEERENTTEELSTTIGNVYVTDNDYDFIETG